MTMTHHHSGLPALLATNYTTPTTTYYHFNYC
jgi:hypothetical protein